MQEARDRALLVQAVICGEGQRVDPAQARGPIPPLQALRSRRRLRDRRNSAGVEKGHWLRSLSASQRPEHLRQLSRTCSEAEAARHRGPIAATRRFRTISYIMPPALTCHLRRRKAGCQVLTPSSASRSTQDFLRVVQFRQRFLEIAALLAKVVLLLVDACDQQLQLAHLARRLPVYLDNLANLVDRETEALATQDLAHEMTIRRTKKPRAAAADRLDQPSSS